MVGGVGLQRGIGKGGIALQGDIDTIAEHLIAPNADAVSPIACPLPLHVHVVPENGGGDLRGGKRCGRGAVQRTDLGISDRCIGVARDAYAGFAAGEGGVDEVHVVDVFGIGLIPSITSRASAPT